MLQPIVEIILSELKVPFTPLNAWFIMSGAIIIISGNHCCLNLRRYILLKANKQPGIHLTKIEAQKPL